MVLQEHRATRISSRVPSLCRHQNEREATMADAGESRVPVRLEGKFKATVFCWVLGLGSLVAWNSILTIGDYYYKVFPVQGGMVGDLSFMCPEFMQSYFAGSAASGALTSALRLMTKAAFDKTHDGLRKGAMLFLAISTFFEFICIILYATWFAKIPIVKSCRFKAASEGCKSVSADLAAAGIQRQDECSKDDRLSNKQLLFQNIDYAIGLYLTHVLTLTIFPGFLYENTGNTPIEVMVFVLTTIVLYCVRFRYSLVLITIYNVWDFISQYIPLISWLKLESRRGLMLATIARFFFVPAFYFTAKYGDQGWMIMLVSFLGLTHGYLTVSVMTIAPKGYKV
ncbi:hypothetical protein NL676_000494 [Syzygium grande]|nr:hypothetical protein NL676_000494 [Syzygium grande]